MSTDVSAPLPEVSLQPGHTITVELDDASAIITELNVYALNLETGETEQVVGVQPVFAYEASG